MELNEQVEQIASREDLVAFVQALRRDLETNPGEWENPNLASYLGALAGWIGDMHGYYRNQGLEMPQAPSWKTVGEILIAAKVYE